MKCAEAPSRLPAISPWPANRHGCNLNSIGYTYQIFENRNVIGVGATVLGCYQGVSDCLLATEVRVRKLSIHVSDDPSAEVRTSLYVT